MSKQTSEAEEILRKELYEEEIASPDYQQLLRQAQKNYHSEVFNSGDLVEWKPNMKNLQYPEYGAPVIVVKMTEKESLDSELAPSVVVRRSDMQIGIIEKGKFTVLKVDSARFKLFENKENLD
ncbi:hypothetical protein PT279_05675 [Bifidobacterium sp. ESL0784]|uniref:hypothetical protein n=1 Tax=Bifidobacterium sp. ESL0784 TaxID=2983231 RepID=UPI0023F87EDF|nr:hypothetical protein [Bifidobacterium sp. ESL0784]MDF7641077.1 hypothetical protein [Bifidobacterium sp. ESL0784]